MNDLQDLKVTINDDNGVALVQFNRLEKRNAFSHHMIGELVTTLAHLDTLEIVRVVVITGGPEGAFCGMSYT
jgi:enoyl-CoA hydratase